MATFTDKILNEKLYFLCSDIGSYGSNYDSCIFQNSTIRKNFFNGKINLPSQHVTEECSSLEELPDFFVGGEAFPRQTCLLRSYPGQGLTEEQIIFNYRLSRAHRLTEKDFGISHLVRGIFFNL